MSYRRKKLLALFFAMALSMTAVAGCTGAKSSTGNVVSLETETNAEETSAQSEAGTFSSADMFTERDLAGTYEESGAVYVTLSDDGIAGETDGVVIDGQMVTITAEGTYIFSGTLSEGQIVVDADNAKVQIVFDNVDITCASSAAVYVKSAEKVFVTLAEGSQNTLRNTDEYVAIDDNNIDAVIFAKSDLTLNGTGSLTIISAEGHGIVSKDDLKIIGGTYDITAAGHALSGKDSVRIADGTFILTAEKDGIHAEMQMMKKRAIFILQMVILRSQVTAMAWTLPILCRSRMEHLTSQPEAALQTVRKHMSQICRVDRVAECHKTARNRTEKACHRWGKSRTEKICHRIPQLTRAAPAQKESRQVAACT